MLLGAIEHVQRAGGDPRAFFGKIFGQEKNLTTAAIARMNLVPADCVLNVSPIVREHQSQAAEFVWYEPERSTDLSQNPDAVRLRR